MYYAVSLLVEFVFLAAAIQLALGAASLAGGIKFFQYVSGRLKSPSFEFDGLVTIFVPCRGLEPGLAENLRKILDQTRDEFEVIFLVDDLKDAAVAEIEKVRAGHANTKLIVAKTAADGGQKIQSLMDGIAAADKTSKAFIFVDSDARPSENWLKDILSPLNDPETGCSSGYRWFVQQTGGFGAHLRSVWNASIASSLGSDSDSNFCWGGSTAIRRSVFEELNVVKEWRGAVSDDFVLTNLLKKSRYRVHFEPKCLTASVGDCSVGELFEFTNRQMKITRVYSPKHFKLSLVGAGLFSTIFFAGIAVSPLTEGVWFYVMVWLLGAIWLLGTTKAVLRVNAASKCLPAYRRPLRFQYFSHGLLWPVSAVLFLLNDLVALCSRKITWRGITYELVSKNETRILNR